MLRIITFIIIIIIGLAIHKTEKKRKKGKGKGGKGVLDDFECKPDQQSQYNHETNVL